MYEGILIVFVFKKYNYRLWKLFNLIANPNLIFHFELKIETRQINYFEHFD